MSKPTASKLHTSPSRGGPTAPSAMSGWGRALKQQSGGASKTLTPPGSALAEPPSPSRGGKELVSPFSVLPIQHQADLHQVRAHPQHIEAQRRQMGRH